MAFCIFLQDGGGDVGGSITFVVKKNLSAGWQAFAGAEQGPPVAIIGFLKQQHLRICTTSNFSAMQAGRDHAGIVHDQHIAGTKQGGEAVELMVSCFTGATVQGEHFGRITPFGGLLGDEAGREVVVKIGCFQGVSC